MTEPNQNQLWRDLDKTADHQEGDRKLYRYSDMGNYLGFVMQRLVPACNCPALREAAQNALEHCFDFDRWPEVRDKLQQALAATPCTSAGESRKWDRLETHFGYHDADDVCRELRKRHDRINEVVQDLIIAEADRNQWKERAEKAKDADMTYGQRNAWGEIYSLCKSLGMDISMHGKSGIDVVSEFIKQRKQGWIPLHGPGSRKPTAEDADDFGRVVYREIDGPAWCCNWSDTSRVGALFHAISKFTPAPDPDTEAFEKWWRSQAISVGTNLQDLKFAWQAALAHRDAQQEEGKSE